MTKLKINKSDEVTNRLPFIPYPQFGNMCPGYLTEVEFNESEIAQDSKSEYAGMTVPRLIFRFTEYKLNDKDDDRFFTHNEFMISHTKQDGSLSTEKNLVSMYTELWKRIKNIHDQFAINPNYKTLTGDLEFDFDIAIDDRIKDMNKFFKDTAKAFNLGKDKTNPIFSPKDLLLLKLVASGQKLSYLAFPHYVGTGIIQKVNILNGKIKTTLTFRPSETVELGLSATNNSTTVQSNTSELPADLAKSLGIG